MNHRPTSRPQPTEVPRPLPPKALSALAERERFLLCLDYDGTLAEITSDPLKAFPSPRAREAIAALAAHPERVALAIVSGRDLDTLRHLLGLRSGMLFAGTHGMEFIGSDGQRYCAPGVEECIGQIAALRDFLARQPSLGRGFIIEDKRIALTLNYRNADPEDARELIARMDDFVRERTPGLIMLEGKMIRETIPAGTGGKGEAVKRFLRETGVPPSASAYLGDDVTDEDAFFALDRDGGRTVMVGAARPSFARWRVSRPDEVADLLCGLAARIAPASSRKRPVSPSG